MKPVLFLSTLLLFTSIAMADSAIYIAAAETEALEAKEGQKVTVYGNVKESKKSSSGTNFVNFEGADFYLVTFKTDLTGFSDGEPSDIYEGKRLAVTGTISVYQGKPQIKLTSPDQIQILAEEDIFPPKTTEATAAESGKPVPAVPEETEKPTEDPQPEKPKPPVDPSQYFKK